MVFIAHLGNIGNIVVSCHDILCKVMTAAYCIAYTHEYDFLLVILCTLLIISCYIRWQYSLAILCLL